QDIFQKKVIVHHPHIAQEFQRFRQDFPKTGLICTSRDPRANLVSCVEKWPKLSPWFNSGPGFLSSLRLVTRDVNGFAPLPEQTIAIRVEDLGHKSTYLQLCNFLGVSYHPSLESSTWAGLAWHSDAGVANYTKGFSAA